MKVSEDRARSAQEDNVDNSEAHDVEDENARLISESNVDNDIEKGQQARESVHEDRESSPSSSGRPGYITVNIKTTTEKRAKIEVPRQGTIADLRTGLIEHASSLECDTKHSKLLFQGRFLTDSETLEVAGVGDGHTVLLVPRPPAATASTSSSTSNSATGGARDVPSPPPEHAGREHLEFILGLMFGFLLGWLAILCFCERRTSKRFFQGLLSGMVLSVIVTLIQYRPMAEHGDHGNK